MQEWGEVGEAPHLMHNMNLEGSVIVYVDKWSATKSVQVETQYRHTLIQNQDSHYHSGRKRRIKAVDRRFTARATAIFAVGNHSRRKTQLRAQRGLRAYLLHNADGRGLTGSGSQDRGAVKLLK